MRLWMCVHAMNVLHLKLRDSSTDSSENSAELIVKQAELSSLIWLVPRQYTILIWLGSVEACSYTELQTFP